MLLAILDDDVLPIAGHPLKYHQSALLIIMDYLHSAVLSPCPPALVILSHILQVLYCAIEKYTQKCDMSETSM